MFKRFCQVFLPSISLNKHVDLEAFKSQLRTPPGQQVNCADFVTVTQVQLRLRGADLRLCNE